jgi:hypothetical protein
MNWYQYLVYKWIEYLDSGAFDGPISIAGDLTVDGDVTVTADNDVTISGTGRYRHGTKTMHYSGHAYRSGIATTTLSYNLDETQMAPTNGAMEFTGLPAGKRMTAVRIRVDDVSTAPLKVRPYSVTGGVYTGLAAQQLSDGSGNAQTLTFAVNATIVTGTTYGILIEQNAFGAPYDGYINKVIYAEVDYDE